MKNIVSIIIFTTILSLILLTGCGSSDITGFSTIAENSRTPTAAQTPSSVQTPVTIITPMVTQTPGTGSSFVLKSSEVENGGTLPTEFTGDGSGATLPLEWSGAPDGTKSYAIIMHHIDPEGKTKWYWILYNIPANIRSLPKNVTEVGMLGNNSINGLAKYAPPHSKGPGPKTYIYTVYALSSTLELSVPSEQVSRDVLLSAMKNFILATAELQVVYTRQEKKPEN